MFKALLSVVFTFLISVNAQAQELKESAKQALPRSAKNAVVKFERESQATSKKFAALLKKIEADYLEEMSATRDNLLEDLKSAMASEAKSVNVEGANKIKKFSTKIASMEFELSSVGFVAKSDKYSKPESANYSDLEGKWNGKWGTTGKPIQLDISDKGERKRGPISLVDGRFLIISPKTQQHMELIPYKNALLVLGWSVKEGRHPTKTLPDHVGIANRGK